MKTYYQLLELEPSASADEIKRAFRREIARYHPDKVQHLGAEFQEIAASRAAELTEAYRVLMDVGTRQKYDDAIAQGRLKDAPDIGQSSSVPPPGGRDTRAAPRPPEAVPQPLRGADRQFDQQRAASSDVVRKAAVAKLRAAVASVAGAASAVPNPAFDLAYVINPKKPLFRKAEPAVRLLARVVPQVNAAAIDEVWPLAMRAGVFDGVSCVLLLGNGLSPSRELGTAISEQRRKTRAGAPVLIPVDMRDWEALFPPEAPEIVRQIVQGLRTA